jgi:NitT/TauT family transport system substrate-binding protein
MKGLTRRGFLSCAGGIGLAAALAPGMARAQSGALVKCIGAHPANITNYAPQLIAISQGFLKDEGLDFSLVVSGGGSKLREIVAADQADFGLGDITHSLQMTNRGRPAKVVMAIDQRCVIANIVVRSDLHEAGIDTLPKLLAWKRPDGSKPIVAVSTLGGGQHAYAAYILGRVPGGENAVTWIAGGVTHTMLGGLQTKKFDAIVAAPSWQFEAEDRGWGKAIVDLRDEKLSNELFGGPVSTTVFYARQPTIDGDRAKTQAYVNAMYRAMQWIKGASVEEFYASVGEKYLNALPPEMVKREIAYYKDTFYFGGVVSPEAYANGGKVWFGGMSEIKPIGFADAVDNSFVEAAREKYGT